MLLRHRMSLIDRVRVITIGSNLVLNALLLSDTKQDLAEGRYDRAIEEAQKALAIHRAARNALAEKEDLNTLGLAHLYRGDYDAARSALDTTLRLDRETDDQMGQIVRLNNLGNIDYFQAKYLDADRRYRQARNLLARNASAPWAARLLARTLANQAVLLQRIGQYDAALQISDQIPQSASVNERAQMLSNRGTLLRRLRDPYVALECYREATRLFQSQHHADGEIGVLKNEGIVLALDLDSPRQALPIFNLALKRAIETSNRREILQARLYRAEALLRLGQTEEAKAEAGAALQAAREMKSVEDEWKALFLQGRLDPDRALHFYLEAISRIEATRSSLELPAMKRDFLADKKQVYDSAIELMLNGSPEALFDMFERSRARSLEQRFSRIPLAELQHRLDTRTMLLETWGRGHMHAVMAISQHSVKVRSWRGPDIRGIAQLTDPQITRLIVVPDGDIERVALDTVSANDGSPLIERFAISYLPVAAALPKPGRPLRWRLPWEHNALALAVPDAGQGQSVLSHAIEEAQAVVLSGSGRSSVRIGQEATAALLHAPTYPIVHVASHAVTNPFSPEGSRLLLGDGPVYLREIYGWKLDQVRLITFSACDTETGEYVGGEGVSGFSRALLASGAQATITTLWPVADGPTADFMRTFYQEFQTKPASEALRSAKLRFMRSTSPLNQPGYWAAFILSGDPDVQAPRFISWWIIAGALLVLGSVCVYSWRG